MSVDIRPFCGVHEFYAAENAAMAEWLLDKPQIAWLHVAESLNWDMAMPAMRWMVEHPECDLAVAAFLFWEYELPWAFKREPSERYTEAEIAAEQGLQLAVAIIERARDRGFPSQGLGLPGRQATRNARDAATNPESCGFADIPTILFGPFAGVFESGPPPEFDATKNTELRALFGGLGSKFITAP